MTVMPMDRSRGGLVASLKGLGAPLPPESVPLTGVRIDVVARGGASAVTVSQRYVNREKVPVEAVYSFPLEEQAGVYGFEALVGDQRVVGEVMEKDKAFDEYDRAMAEGDGAYLLDQDRPNLFTASVGNLLPGQQAVVTVRYVAKLERLGDQVRLKIPTTVAPRYIPEQQLRQMDPSEFDHLNPPTVPGGVPYGLALSVSFQGASAVTSVECPSHPVRVSTRGKKATVKLSGPDVQLDRDVVMTFTMKDAGETALYAALDDAGDTVLMLDVLPPRDVHRAPVEAVFLIDRSGSMAGSSIEQARAALLLALSSLQEGDRFNVVGFGSSVQSVFTGAVCYDDASLDLARKAIGTWDADLGGTEISTPLRQILEAQSGELPRRLLVLTDGEVANEDECLELAGRHPETAVFTLGVGYGASEHLVRGLARNGRGQAEFVHPGERIEPALMRQIARLTTAGLLEPQIDWGGLDVELVAPAELPPLYPGAPLVVFARVPAEAREDPGTGARRPVEVTLRATGPDGEVRMTAAADLAAAAADDAVPRLFAHEAIRDLEEGRAGAAAGGSQQRDRREGRVKDAIVALATRYTLMSSCTSFVAVERREGEAADQPPAELRRIPVALLTDWHGSGVGARGPVFNKLMVADSMAMQDGSWAAPLRDGELPPTARRSAARSGPAFSIEGLHEQSAIAFSMTPPHVTLASRQRADGSWSLDDVLSPPLGIPQQRLATVASELQVALGVNGTTAATALAVFLLRRLFSNEQDEWQMVADKAEAWLIAQGIVLESLWQALDEAMGQF